MTETIIAKLKELASYLPKDEYEASFSLYAYGEDLVKKFPDLTLIDGGILDPDKLLYVKDPVERDCNHFRRMKRAFEKSGKTGVLNYFMKYTNKNAVPEVRKRVASFL